MKSGLKRTSTLKSITDFISTLSPIPTTISTISPKHILTTFPTKEIIDAENEIVPDAVKDQEDPSHILKCTPSTSMAPTADGTPFDCLDEASEKEDITPFIVMIRISSDDLSSVLTKRVKIVVKDFMLMDMPTPVEQFVNLSPK